MEPQLKDLISVYEVCKEALNIHDHLKKKYIRGNIKPFTNKILSKAT